MSLSDTVTSIQLIQRFLCSKLLYTMNANLLSLLPYYPCHPKSLWSHKGKKPKKNNLSKSKAEVSIKDTVGFRPWVT